MSCLCRRRDEGFVLLVGRVGRGAGVCWILLATALREYAKEPRITLHWAGCLCLQNACRRGGAGWGCRVRQGGVWLHARRVAELWRGGPRKSCGCVPTQSFLHQAQKHGHSQCSVCAGGRHVEEARVLLDPGGRGPWAQCMHPGFRAGCFLRSRGFYGWGWGMQRCGRRARRISLSVEPC